VRPEPKIGIYHAGDPRGAANLSHLSIMEEGLPAAAREDTRGHFASEAGAQR